ncbi:MULTISPECIES: hypothetical protein [Brasilonema]|nr:hypothetical protein [Brasilonema sennae]
MAAISWSLGTGILTILLSSVRIPPSLGDVVLDVQDVSDVGKCLG